MILFLLLVLLAPLGRAAAQDTFTGVDRIVAVGDIHGDFKQFVRVLRDAGLIDDRNRWRGGRAHLVQTGDVLDRGPDSRKVMDLLIALEQEAKKAGGWVHALIGNHEAMNIFGDLRYVSAAEYAAFRTPKSEALRERAYPVLADSARKADPAYRAEWEAAHPLGWVEQRIAFAPNGRYRTWIAKHNAVIRIDDYVFLHGGIGPAYAGWSLEEINDAVRQDLATAESDTSLGIAEDPEGPLWYRGLARGDEALLAPLVDSVLAGLGATHVVIGHTVTEGTVIPRFGGKVIMIDVGLSAVYGGPPACLIVERGKPYTLHRGRKLPLPLGDDELLPYLEAAAALDPQPSRLQKLIDRLASSHLPVPAGVPDTTANPPAW